MAMADFHWKSVFRGWVGIPILILAALTAVWLFASGPSLYENWQAKRAYEKMMEPYYNDTYGGKTPEETYDMFIDALKKGDIELASKYFVVEKQDDWMKTLEEYKDENLLDSFVTELENTKKIWEKSEKNTETTTSFKYKVFIGKNAKASIDGQEVGIPEGDYINESVFDKYPSGIWKISGI